MLLLIRHYELSLFLQFVMSPLIRQWIVFVVNKYGPFPTLLQLLHCRKNGTCFPNKMLGVATSMTVVNQVSDGLLIEPKSACNGFREN